eukprot:88952_1
MTSPPPSASASVSSSSMGGKSDVQSLPDDIAEELSAVLDNSESTLVAVWNIDCSFMSNALQVEDMYQLKKLLFQIVMKSISSANTDTLAAIKLMKSVFGRKMWISFRSLFNAIQHHKYLSAEMEFLFYRFPKQFMFLGRLIGRNFQRVKAAIEQILDDEGFPVLDREIDFRLCPEPVPVDVSDALFEQFPELTDEEAKAEVEKSSEPAPLFSLKRKREVSSKEDRMSKSSRTVSGFSNVVECCSVNVGVAGDHTSVNPTGFANNGIQPDPKEHEMNLRRSISVLEHEYDGLREKNADLTHSSASPERRELIRTRMEECFRRLGVLKKELFYMQLESTSWVPPPPTGPSTSSPFAVSSVSQPNAGCTTFQLATHQKGSRNSTSHQRSDQSTPSTPFSGSGPRKRSTAPAPPEKPVARLGTGRRFLFRSFRSGSAVPELSLGASRPKKKRVTRIDNTDWCIVEDPTVGKPYFYDEVLYRTSWKLPQELVELYGEWFAHPLEDERVSSSTKTSDKLVAGFARDRDPSVLSVTPQRSTENFHSDLPDHLDERKAALDKLSEGRELGFCQMDIEFNVPARHLYGSTACSCITMFNMLTFLQLEDKSQFFDKMISEAHSSMMNGTIEYGKFITTQKRQPGKYLSPWDVCQLERFHTTVENVPERYYIGPLFENQNCGAKETLFSQALSKILESGENGTFHLVIAGYTVFVGFWEGIFYLVDSHRRDRTGARNPRGTGIAMKFRNTSSFQSTIYRLYIGGKSDLEYVLW